MLALAAGSGSCPRPVAQSPADDPILPGVLGNVLYSRGLALDAYAPGGPPCPATVIGHGSYGSKRAHVTQLLELLDRAGYAWFSVDYRTPEDLVQAMDFIRCPGRFNITPETTLIGEDTGAEVALELASREHVAGVVTFGLKLRSSNVEAPSGRGAPISSFDFRGPVLMFHRTADEQAPLAQARALRGRLPRCTFEPVPGGIHEFENWRPDQWFWKEDLTAWLRHDRRGLWKDIAYSRPGGRPLLMDTDIAAGAGPFPAVSSVHGGGWEAGDKVTHASPVFEPLARAGFAWFSTDYRLTPYVHVAEQLDDVRAAVRYVREHAARFHVDPDRLALLGESAGGHRAAAVASEGCPGCEVQAVVLFYGVYDFTRAPEEAEWRGRLGRLFGAWTPETLRHYAPLDQIRPSLPPILLIQGTADELHKGTLVYAARLKAAGARYELVLLQGARHGMGNWEGDPQWMFYKRTLVDWLNVTRRRP